ncbi:MAG: inositol monophosphatase [Planctomycetes bacterium]|nr:inositol monophosphatase [Planctomycetota bacterium]
MNDFAEVCQRAARAGGSVVRALAGRIQPREKAPKDLVTEADFASQEAIRKVIQDAYPEHLFLGEEDPAFRANPTPADIAFCWIVDPLDGTLNYVHQLPNYCVSVALRQGDEITVGAVFDPVHDVCFTAEAGRGAYVDDRRLIPSVCSQFNSALIGASLPVDVCRDSRDVRQFLEVVYQSRAIRRLGSAALNLCYVASGSLDGYWATRAKIWDVAAGQLIVREAGGQVTRPDGTSFDLDDPQFVASATPELHRQFLKVLEECR